MVFSLGTRAGGRKVKRPDLLHTPHREKFKNGIKPLD